MPMRGIRGATVANRNEPEMIYAATREILECMLERNPSLKTADIASVFFTMTGDLTSAYPALAARQLGWTGVPLLCAQEIPVPGGLERTIRVLLHWNTDLAQDEIQHVYLKEAKVLRPDWIGSDIPQV